MKFFIQLIAFFIGINLQILYYNKSRSRIYSQSDCFDCKKYPLLFQDQRILSLHGDQQNTIVYISESYDSTQTCYGLIDTLALTGPRFNICQTPNEPNNGLFFAKIEAYDPSRTSAQEFVVGWAISSGTIFARRINIQSGDPFQIVSINAPNDLKLTNARIFLTEKSSRIQILISSGFSSQIVVWSIKSGICFYKRIPNSRGDAIFTNFQYQITIVAGVYGDQNDKQQNYIQFFSEPDNQMNSLGLYKTTDLTSPSIQMENCWVSSDGNGIMLLYQGLISSVFNLDIMYVEADFPQGKITNKVQKNYLTSSIYGYYFKVLDFYYRQASSVNFCILAYKGVSNIIDVSYFFGTFGLSSQSMSESRSLSVLSYPTPNFYRAGFFNFKNSIDSSKIFVAGDVQSLKFNSQNITNLNQSYGLIYLSSNDSSIYCSDVNNQLSNLFNLQFENPNITLNFIDQCQSAPVMPKFPLTINYTIGSGYFSVGALVNSSTIDCGVNITFLLPDGSQIPNSILFQFRKDWIDINITDFALAGSYNITQKLTSSGSGLTRYSCFTLNAIDNCLNYDIIPPSLTIFYIGLNDSKTLPINFTTTANPSECDLNYSAIVLPNFSNFNVLAKSLIVTPNSLSDIGAYNVKIISFFKFRSIEIFNRTLNFSIIVNNSCMNPISAASIPNQEYKLGYPERIFQMNAWTGIPSICDSLIFTASGFTSSFMTFNSSSLQFKIFSNSSADIGDHNITVFTTSYSQQSIFFNLSIIDPCQTANITSPIQPPIVISFLQPATVTQILPFNSSEATNMCGAINYQYLQNSSAVVQQISKVDIGNLTVTSFAPLASLNDQQFDLIIIGSLTGRSQISLRVSISVQIVNSCNNCTIYTSALLPQTYSIFNDEKTISFDPWTSSISFCNSFEYSASLSNNSDQSVFTSRDIKNRKIVVYSNDYMKADTYNVTIAGNILSQSFSSMNFLLTVINPCLLDQLVPITMPDIIYYTGSGSKVFYFQEWTHQNPNCNSVQYTADLAVYASYGSIDTLGFLQFLSFMRSFSVNTVEVPNQSEYKIRLKGFAKGQTASIFVRMVIIKGNIYAPSFKIDLQNVEIEAGKEVSIIIPEIQDLDGDSWLPPAIVFGKATFVIGAYPRYTLKPQLFDANTFPVSITLTDTNKQIQKSATYTFKIIVSSPKSQSQNQTETEAENSTAKQRNETNGENSQSSDQNPQSGFDINTLKRQSQKLSNRQITTGPLTAIVSSVSSFGIITVSFNQDLVVPENYQNQINDTIIKINLELGSYDDPNSFKFTWKVASFSPEEMQIQILFANPLLISKSETTKVSIKFLQKNVFKSDWTGKALQSTKSNSMTVPRQMKLDALTTALQSSSSIAKGAVGTAMYGTFAFNLFLQFTFFTIKYRSTSMGLLWGMVNVMQVICTLPLFNLSFPANANFALSLVTGISNFDLLPTTKIFAFFFDFTTKNEIRRRLISITQILLDDSSSLSQSLVAIDIFQRNSNNSLIQFQTSTRNDGNFIQNIGSNFIYAIGFAILYILMIPIKSIGRKFNRQ